MRGWFELPVADLAGRLTFLLFIAVAIAPAAWSQSIRTEDSIETDGQVVSKAAKGTPPLDVSSSTKVSELNVDYFDGYDSLDFAFYSELLSAIADLDNPDPPCFNNTDRFVDCGNGTVTDTATGLIYLKDANCFGKQDWTTANQSAAGLAAGSCGLADGSRAGDWRLQTKEEWEGILAPDCPDEPLIVGGVRDSYISCYTDSPWASGVEADLTGYWSSATYTSGFSTFAWLAGLKLGRVGPILKTSERYVWPVRGGR